MHIGGTKEHLVVSRFALGFFCERGIIDLYRKYVNIHIWNLKFYLFGTKKNLDTGHVYWYKQEIASKSADSNWLVDTILWQICLLDIQVIAARSLLKGILKSLILNSS